MGKTRCYCLNSIKRASVPLEPKGPVTIEDMEPRRSREEERPPIRGSQLRHTEDSDIPAKTLSVTRGYIGTISGDRDTSNALADLLREMGSPIGSDFVAIRALGTEGIDDRRDSVLRRNRQHILGSVDRQTVQPGQCVTEKEPGACVRVSIGSASADQYGRLGASA